MKRSKPNRLLTPTQMNELMEVVYKRDGGCKGKVWPLHKCGGFRYGGMYEADHIIEQGWLRTAYSLGGVWKGDAYRPIKAVERGLIESEITASDIAADPGLCICLCCDLHDRKGSLTPAEKLELIGDQITVLTYCANRYSLGHRLIEALA